MCIRTALPEEERAMSTDKLFETLRLPYQTDPPPNSNRLGSNQRANMDGPSYHSKRRCDMARIAQRVMGLAVLTCLGLSSSLPCAAETSKVGSATKQVESGAKQVGRGVEDTA